MVLQELLGREFAYCCGAGPLFCLCGVCPGSEVSMATRVRTVKKADWARTDRTTPVVVVSRTEPPAKCRAEKTEAGTAPSAIPTAQSFKAQQPNRAES